MPAAICHPLQCIISECQNKRFQTWPWKAAKWSLSKVDPTLGTSWNLDPFEPPGGPKDSKIAANFLFLQAYFCTFKLFPLQVSRVWNQVLLLRTDSGYHLALKISWRLRIVIMRTCFDRTLNEANIAATESDSHSLAIAVRQSLPVVLLFCNCLTTNSIHSQAPLVQSWPYFHSAHLSRGQKTGAAKVHALKYENQ